MKITEQNFVPVINEIIGLCRDVKMRAGLMRLAELETSVNRWNAARIERMNAVRELLETGPATKIELRQATGYTTEQIRDALADCGAKPVSDATIPQYAI